MKNKTTVINLKHPSLRKNRYIILAAALSLLITVFIFSNSLQNGEDSNERSGNVVEMVKPIVDPDDRIPEPDFHKLIRKAAHFTEFAALGFCLGALMQSIRTVYGRYHIFMCLFLTLAVAVTDEFIQSFTGRTSSVTDVLIDFSGALTGLALLCLLAALLRRIGPKIKSS